MLIQRVYSSLRCRSRIIDELVSVERLQHPHLQSHLGVFEDEGRKTLWIAVKVRQKDHFKN